MLKLQLLVVWTVIHRIFEPVRAANKVIPPIELISHGWIIRNVIRETTRLEVALLAQRIKCLSI